MTTGGVLDGLGQGRLDGVKIAPVWAVHNKHWRDARHITAFALSGSIDTLVAPSSAWERLSANDQDAVRAVAEDTVAFIETLPERDTAGLEQLYRAGGPADLNRAARLTFPATYRALPRWAMAVGRPPSRSTRGSTRTCCGWCAATTCVSPPAARSAIPRTATAPRWI